MLSDNTTNVKEYPSFEVKNWPQLENAALAGPAGRFVDLATRSSEADPAAVLITFLVRFGVEVGPEPFLYVGDAKHRARTMAVIVGNSSKARKGTSGKPVTRSFRMGLLEEHEIYLPAHTSPGPLSSGEGLIYAVRDPVMGFKTDKKTGTTEEVLLDPGVEDKRLFILDEEFASCLSVTKREGNTLSTVLRSMWDSGNLEPLTKNNRIRSTGAHIGVISHITLAELNRKLDDVEAFSGFANRILWVCARRQGLVPFPKPMPDSDLGLFQRDLRGIVGRCHTIREMSLTGEVEKLWTDLYPVLSQDHPGLVGAVINRAEAQAMRLAMIYALLDASQVIERKHLESALAMWNYCQESAEFIFHGRECNPHAQRILDALDTGVEMTTTDLYNALSRNINKRQMEEAIADLLSQKKIVLESKKQDGRGRPTMVFRASSGSRPYEENELNELNKGAHSHNNTYEENEENELNLNFEF
jgi:hypothetical protein